MDRNHHHSPGDTLPKSGAPSGPPQPGSQQHASESGSGSGSGVSSGGSAATGSILGSIASSAKTLASSLDPRQATHITQHGGFSQSNNVAERSSSSASSSTFLGGSSSKGAAGSSSTRAFQHASQALETLGGSSNSARAGLEQSNQGFRTSSAAPGPGANTAGGGGMTMDWDNFLASSESTLTEDRPYQPPTYSFESMSLSEPRVDSFQSTTRLGHTNQTPTTLRHHLSQPINLTPANHAAFLQYLRSTTAPSQPPQSSQQHLPSGHQTGGGLQSRDVLRQQQLDGGDVLQFLNSTSYSDFVENVESAGLDKHQMERREFVYEDVITGPGARAGGGRLATLLSLIQNLPSERQDVVQYLLQQGTYTDDIWSQPFGHNAERVEAASMAATMAEQDQFLKQQQGRAGGGTLLDEEEAEMERVLQQVVDDAKKEAEAGDTNGKALDRLLMVRKHLAKL